ncbi:unnamed protein product [Mytilus coruscus]|uniref:Mab-21-like HhH/H2TH-like domain-containing protein n=1 Tax=Mytilus coruscus TaxID=42192 RepID=A0A6J8BX16_MYTCO|nr:unnamed protein product [Mytilus coruscus]
MAGISMETCDSLNFYKYLCQRIGSEEDVKIRRLAFVIRDIGRNNTFITSGSKGEGLNLNGSDIDVMFIDRCAQVYESEAEVVIEGKRLPFIMYTEDTPPCFTQLYLLTHHQNQELVSVSVSLLNMLDKNHLGYAFSSELYKLFHLSNAYRSSKIHGPCISDEFDQHDLAYCLKCDTWIRQAKPWISRPRTAWPSPELISKIISCETLTTILKNIYGQGINCFAFSETLQDYQNQCYEINESIISKNNRCLQHFMPLYCNILNSGRVESFSRLLYDFLHHSRTGLSKGLFALQISAAFKVVPVTTTYPYSSTNRKHYLMYKNDLSHLMIGLHSDAISGLLMLASFFYVAKNYLASLTVLTYTMEKYTDEIIYLRVFNNRSIHYIKQHVVKLTNKEKLHTILKSLTTCSFEVDHNSSIVPQELQQDVASDCTIFHPLPFAHFLRFLCCYHLHDISSSRQSLQQLEHVQWTLSEGGTLVSHPDSLNTVIMCGIAHQLLGDIHSASHAFLETAARDKNNETSAASRLYSLF